MRWPRHEITWKGSTLFFFSSRRRHTRLVSDWSSDVCSSDLATKATTGSASSPPPALRSPSASASRSEEHTSELQSLTNLVCRLLLEKKNMIEHGCERENNRSLPGGRARLAGNNRSPDRASSR